MAKKNISTASEKIFEVRWLGVSSLDKSLRFELLNVGIAEAFTVFSDNLETSKIVYKPDRPDRQVYEGYTTLISIAADSDDSVVVALVKGD